MDILLQPRILADLKVFLATVPLPTDLTLAIESVPPLNPTYPLLVFSEVRNQPTKEGFGYRQRVTQFGFEVNIYMTQHVEHKKDEIVRLIMFYADQYLSIVEGLRCLSCNYFKTEPYSCTAMYICTEHENKQEIY
jgi:hypothetical protein